MPKDPLDVLYAKVANKILTETLHVRKGEAVTVEAWDNGLPFARRAVAEARAMGCSAIMVYEDEGAYIEGVRRAPEDTIGMMGRNEYGLLSGTDAYIFIPGPAINAYSRILKPEERVSSTRYNSSWYDAAQKAGLRGARLSFGYVGKDLAGLLGKKIQDVVRAQLRAALADYGQIARSAEKISPLMADGAGAELGSGRSSLGFSLQGEHTVEDGVVDNWDRETGNNMAYVPPGLVTKDVVAGSTNGNVTLIDTLTKYGVISRVDLEFKDGRIVAWDSKDRARVKKIFDAVLPEKRNLSTLGVGLNPELAYGVGHDRFVEGSVTLSGFGFTGLVKKGTLSIAGSKVLENGRLREPHTG
ncbi:MAG: hypothetical protein KGI38_01095 [Thaumarchaeota archaeon]|nr:hypothetical protein [Nitrososphaerota archaeon]